MKSQAIGGIGNEKNLEMVKVRPVARRPIKAARARRMIAIFKLLTPGRSLDLLVVTENFSLFYNSPVMLSILDVD